MRFECSKCKTPYSIPDSRIQGKMLKIRCQNCGEIMEVRSSHRKPSLPAASKDSKSAPPPPSEAKKIWYVGLDGNEQGPLSEEEITQLARLGKIDVEHYVWRHGFEDWKPITEVPELATLFDRPPKPPPRRKTGSFPASSEKSTSQTQEASSSGNGETHDSSPQSAADEDQERLELLKRVHQRRQQARADRQADRIAEYFFQSTHLLGETHTLPPPPVDDGAASEEAESSSPVDDPLSRVVGNEELPDETSKVTKALAEKAGVSQQHTKKRLWVTLLIIFGLVGLLSGLMALGFSKGWFSGFKIGGEEKFTANREENIDLLARLSPEEARKLRERILDQPKKHSFSEKTPILPTSVFEEKSQTPPSEQEKELMAFYQQDAERKREIVPRGLDHSLLQSISTSEILTTGSAGMTPNLPDLGKNQVVPQTVELPTHVEDLSEDQIKLVINSHYRGLRSCVERQLKRDARLVGKLVVSALVKPEGKVEKVWINTEKFRGTYIEECLQAEIARWEFPRFKGPAREINFPLLLSAQTD